MTAKRKNSRIEKLGDKRKNMKTILGLAGEISSGKGTVAKYIAKEYKGNVHRFSTMLRDVAKRMHLEENRDNLQKISTMLREYFGEDILSKTIYFDVQNDKNKVVVIDGVRRPSDLKYLRKIAGFKLVYIEAEMEKRYERIVKRGENTDDTKKTFKEFQKDHKKEAEKQIRGMRSKADVVVDNNGNFKELYCQVDKLIK